MSRHFKEMNYQFSNRHSEMRNAYYSDMPFLPTKLAKARKSDNELFQEIFWQTKTVKRGAEI